MHKERQKVNYHPETCMISLPAEEKQMRMFKEQSIPENCHIFR